MSHFSSKLRASESEFWLARHRDESLRLEVTRVKNEFWLARARDEPLRLEVTRIVKTIVLVGQA